MTLDEAIENLESFESVIDPMTQQWLIDSIKLGIEAMTHVQYQRKHPTYYSARLLPGETED